VRWKPFANLLALVGPEHELQNAKTHFNKVAHSMKATFGDIVKLSASNSIQTKKENITRTALDAWAQLNPLA
jgi:hypothetical protein